MDKKDSNRSSGYLSDKLKDAAGSVCPVFKSIRRIAHRQSSPSSALKAPMPKSTSYVSNSKIIEIHSRPDPPKLAKPGHDRRHQKGELVAINFDFEKPKPFPQPHVMKAGSDVGLKANPEVESHKKTGVQIEDRFTDYINRARNIFRSSTFVESDYGKEQKNDEVSSNASAAGKDHKFNDFIDRAKKKFRTTSSIGGGRSVSFK